MEFNEFRDRVTFVQYIHNSPYPEDVEDEELYSCFCKIYSSSSKDIQILQTMDSKLGFTVVIRDAYPEFLPQNNQVIKVANPLYADKTFNILEIRQNTPQPGYLTLVLSEI